MNPDLIKPPPVGFFPKLQHFFDSKVLSNELGRHLFFIDLLLLIVGVFSFFAGISELDLVFFVVIAIFLIDTIVCLLSRVEIETWTSIDSDLVYETSLQRIS